MYETPRKLQISQESTANFASLPGAGLTKEKGLVVRELRIIHEAESSYRTKVAGSGLRLFAGPGVYRCEGRLRIPRGQYVRTISQKVGKAGMAGAVTRYEAQG